MADDAQAVRGGQLGPTSRFTYAMLHTFLRMLAYLYFRAFAHNRKNLARKGAVIISPVHRSNLDVPLLGITCPRRLRYLAKGSLFKNKFWAWFLTLIGGFPLDRDVTADFGALKAALSVLDRGEALVVFPEGERKDGPWVHPVMDGAVWLSCRSGAPILPVGIGGSQKAMPKRANLPRPSKLVFQYGHPIFPPKNDDGSRVTRSQMHAHSQMLRATIQQLFDEAQETAGSPNPPRDQRPPMPEDA